MRTDPLTPEQKSSLKKFFTRRTEAGPEYTVSKAALAATFIDWVETRKGDSLTYNHLRQEMAVRGFTEHRNKTTRYWKGLRLSVLTNPPQNLTNQESSHTTSELYSNNRVVKPETKESVQVLIDSLIENWGRQENPTINDRAFENNESAVECLLRRRMSGV